MATTREVLTAARQNARDSESASTSDLIELLAKTINRVTVRRDSIQIHISRTDLRTRLLGIGTHFIDTVDQIGDSGDDIFYSHVTPLSVSPSIRRAETHCSGWVGEIEKLESRRPPSSKPSHGRPDWVRVPSWPVKSQRPEGTRGSNGSSSTNAMSAGLFPARFWHRR